MSEEIAISLQNVSKCFKRYAHPVDRLKELLLPQKTYAQEFWALQDINLKVPKGHSLGIVGRNGSGKSTLLQIVVGTLTTTSGEARVNGRISALLELGSGFNSEFTGRQNVFLNGRLLGLEQQQIEAKFDDIAAFADIGDFIEQPVKTYSSGMFIRLAFAVAINVEPDILVVDEALAVGDEAFQRKCFSRIQAIQDSGGTILFVSHSASHVIELCDSAVLLDRGDLLLYGSPKSVITNYHKLIYAPADKIESLREEIKNINSQNVEKNLHPDDKVNKLTTKVLNSKSQLLEQYDPNLIPKSTIYYIPRGAEIEEPHITTVNGQRINILNRRNEYIYTYKVNFLQSAFRVRFGMMIKTVSGVELGGAASHTFEKPIDSIEAGDIIEVKFKFDCNLQPGVYFLNAGVVGTIDGTEVFLHRIHDVAMFRVQPEEDILTTGTIDFLIEPHISLLEITRT
ncbi:MAG: ABC transporter ATP-binding protein [Cyanobacteria bacterium P01_D01_bin.50]